MAKKDKAKLENVLVMVPLFRGLPKRHLKKVANLCEVGEYMAGAAIVKKGEPGDAFYVVLSGQAKVTSGRTFLGRVLAGDHFGEIAVLDGGVRSATVTSETPMTLLILRRADLLKSLKDDPDLARHMMAELAKMVRRVNDSISQ